MGMRRGPHATLVCLTLLLAGPSAAGTEPGAPGETAEEIGRIRAEMAALRADYEARISALETRLVRLEQGTPASLPPGSENEAAALRAAAEAEAARIRTEAPVEPPSGTAAVGRERNLNALNPEISVTGDVLSVLGADETDRFEPRSVELAIQSSLDPFSKIKVVASADGFEEILVEEGFAVWTGLPGRTSLKFGRFFQQVGNLNRYHIHGLPQADRPAPFHVMFGEEGRLAGDGVSLNWLLPGPGGGSFDLTAEVANASNEESFSGAEFDSLTGLVRGLATWNVGARSLAEVGLTALGGSNGLGPDSETWIGGLETLFRWTPAGRGKYRGFDLRGELFRIRRDDPEGVLRSWAGYVYGEARLGRSWLAGLRVDRSEDPLDPGAALWSYNPYVTFWQSEFVRLRAQLQLLRGDLDEEATERFFFQATFSAGPHKHEAY